MFSPKCIPWFVSDVTPPDFSSIFTSLEQPNFFVSDAPSTEAREHLADLVRRWRGYVDSGVFALSVPMETPLGKPAEMYDFWTEAHPFWEMEARAPALFKNLLESGLVIFKVGCVVCVSLPRALELINESLSPG
jgi:damage-control phosphatase, subfamily III